MALLADVAYVDMLEGDTECHVRFNTPEDAQTVIKSHKEIQIKNNWKYEVLTGKIFLVVVQETFLKYLCNFKDCDFKNP